MKAFLLQALLAVSTNQEYFYMVTDRFNLMSGLKEFQTIQHANKTSFTMPQTSRETKSREIERAVQMTGKIY